MALKDRRLAVAMLIAALGLLPATAAADIYKYVDKHGRVILTDKPNHSGYKRLIRTWKGWEEAKSQIALRDLEKNQARFAATIRYYAERYGLPLPLLHAVITAESAYDPEAVSRAGAVGLMQLMPDTARRYGVGNRRNPSDNINGGTRYLRDLLKMFNNNVILALAAYNAGENAVIRSGNQVPPYEETRRYVQKVIDYYKEYRKTLTSVM